MIRIGDFSKLSRVPVKTLRYYDEIGLLKPIHVDGLTGYRSYDCSQLPRLQRILSLKDMGFSLEEIGRLLVDGLSIGQMRSMLQDRREQIRSQVQVENERLERVAARLKQIEQEDGMSGYDVVIKKVEALKVASIRDRIRTYPEQGHLWRELEGYLAMHRVHPVGACLTVYHDEEYVESDVDAEVCEPIESQLAESRRIKVHTLPPVQAMACAVHHGPFNTLQGAYDSILKWIDGNGYRICGPGREVYLQTAGNSSQTDPNTVTEIQFPVEKTQ